MADNETEHKPYVSPDEEVAEIKPRSLFLGVLLSVVLGATNVYAGLLAGVTTSASIPASIISMGVLRLFPDSTILENNMVQTAASAGESLAAGVIFTLPAMYLFAVDKESKSDGWLNYVNVNNYFTTLLLCWFGGVLGVLFSVPIRRALIVEKTVDPPLTYPEGIATAKVLIKGYEGGSDVRGLKALSYGAAIGCFFSFLNEGLGVVSTHITVGGYLTKKASVLLEIGLSPITMSIGYIVGWRVAIVMTLGSVVQFFFAIPIAQTVDTDESYFDERPSFGTAAYTYWKKKTRNMGVGAMLFGSLWVLFDIRHSLIRAVSLGVKAFTGGMGSEEESDDNKPRGEREMPMKYVLISIVACVIILYIAFSLFLENWWASAVLAIAIVVLGFLFSSVAGFNAGLVGSSNNPVSGVTISTVLITSLLVRLMLGSDDRLGAPVSVLIGTVVCCAAAISGDNLQDLKCGYLLGATPRNQVYMQMLGVTVAAFIMAPVLHVLADSYGFGDEGLPAPQGFVMKSISEGVIYGTLPVSYLCIGAAVAACVIVIDQFLKSRQSTFRMPVMAFAIGFYLPMYLGSGVLIGSIVQLMAGRETQLGLLHAAGMITGYGLMGLFIAAVVVIYSLITDETESPLGRDTSGIDSVTATALSFFQLGLIFYSLYSYAILPDDDGDEEEVKQLVDEDSDENEKKDEDVVVA